MMTVLVVDIKVRMSFLLMKICKVISAHQSFAGSGTDPPPLTSEALI